MMELKNSIVTLCNESGLPLEAILFIVKDIYRDAEESYAAYQERQAIEKARAAKKQDIEVEKISSEDVEVEEE